MTHLPARPGHGLAVKMECRAIAGKLGHPQHIVADQVLHRDIRVPRAVAKRPARDRTDMLFELVDDTAVLCPMPGIVHARGEFIDQKRARLFEKFNADHADISQRIKDLSGNLHGIGGNIVGNSAGHRGGVKDTVPVDILAGGEGRHGPVRSPRRDHGKLPLERDMAFENRGRALQFGQRRRRALQVRNPRLPLAVIPEAPGLEDRGRPDRGGRAA